MAPDTATFAFTGVIMKDSGAYGYKLVIASIPPVLAAGNTVSFTTFDTNIGGSIKYKGKNVNQVTMPTKKQCPKGGFKWESDFNYTDGTSTSFKSTSPCPSH